MEDPGKHPSSLAALKIALQGAEQVQAKTILLDIRELSLPIYDPADENPPHSVLEMCAAIYRADGLIWSSPIQECSGLLKLLGARNPPYLTDKDIGLISTAGGMQGLQAVNTMEFVVHTLRAVELFLW